MSERWAEEAPAPPPFGPSGLSLRHVGCFSETRLDYKSAHGRALVCQLLLISYSIFLIVSKSPKSMNWASYHTPVPGRHYTHTSYLA